MTLPDPPLPQGVDEHWVGAPGMQDWPYRAWMRARDGSPEVERLVCSLEKPITRVKWNFPGDLEECR